MQKKTKSVLQLNLILWLTLEWKIKTWPGLVVTVPRICLKINKHSKMSLGLKDQYRYHFDNFQNYSNP